jgi:hypothetical protein
LQNRTGHDDSRAARFCIAMSEFIELEYDLKGVEADPQELL